jgi:hypothetical protein
MSDRLVWDVPSATLQVVELTDEEFTDGIAAGTYQDPRDGALAFIDGKGDDAPPLNLAGSLDTLTGGEVDFSVTGGAATQSKVTIYFGDGSVGQDTTAPFALSHAYGSEAPVIAKAINDFGQTDYILLEPDLAPPTFASISPSTVASPGADTTVTLTGTNFESDTTAKIDGVTVATTFVSATSLTILVPDEKLAVPGTVVIGVNGLATTKDLTVT